MRAIQTGSSAGYAWFGLAIMGVALIVTLGILALGDTGGSRPGTGSNQTAAAGAEAAMTNDASLTRAGHRYQLYLAEGVVPAGSLARYAGEHTSASDLSNHRYFDLDIEVVGSSGDGYENHRIEQNVD